MKITFKQYSQLVELDEPSEDQLTEIFGFGRKPDKIDQAKKEREALIKQHGAEKGAQQYALLQKQRNLAWAKAKAKAEAPPQQKKYDNKSLSDLGAPKARATERDWVSSIASNS